MLCKQCGTENINPAGFCVGCGAPLASASADEKKPEIGYCGQPIEQKKNIRPWLLAGAAAFALLLLIVVLVSALGGNGFKETAEAFVVAYLTDDLQTMEQVTEKNLYHYLRTDARLQKAAEHCEATALSSEPCPEDRMDDLRELYAYLGVKGNFTDAHLVEVEYTVTSAGKESTTTANIIVNKVDGTCQVVFVGQ